ncbi:Similar to hypothetical protein [Tuber melanosporum Mel28]; acc. no. XP_002838637 [Pyronema omphalodes CBS 100304]|uniref:HAUS augmin-like complex subunit 6 N-terminal domain-containing protein n=1 Tax=Pyronema omphalodes (strain CBS 100304) TaxID=1076935 RepID=U4L1I9_PYROM|nr:Similar to hypothetical protein [Tuber melanosporum Mel28]; acc. no. XP_002838637 [Pyronema omphalodes CBS 100304]
MRYAPRFPCAGPADTIQKLAPLFPCYEPAQSRELRNAVFKWLEDLKKSSKLGGVLIRRTTLDDCCGQRYEELLLALSTMVIRSKIENGTMPGFQMSFAYEQAVSLQPSQTHLVPLAIAHRVVLGKMVEKRRGAKEKWAAFARLMDQREEKVREMEERVRVQEEEDRDREEKETQTKRSKTYEENVIRKWKNNWLGDPRWLDIILNGDPEATRDRFLELGFEQAFENQEYFREERDKETTKISLKGLDDQVAEQRRRVEEIRRLRELSGGLTSKAPVSPVKPAMVQETEEKKRGIKIEFTEHQALHIKNMVDLPKRKKDRQNEYSDLLNNLREEMILASAPAQRAYEKPEVPMYYNSNYSESEDFSNGAATPAYDTDEREVYNPRLNVEHGTPASRSDYSGSLGFERSPIPGRSPIPDDGIYEHEYSPNMESESIAELVIESESAMESQHRQEQDQEQEDYQNGYVEEDTMDIDSHSPLPQPRSPLPPSRTATPLHDPILATPLSERTYSTFSPNETFSPFSAIRPSQYTTDKKRNSLSFGEELHRPQKKNSFNFDDDSYEEQYAEQIVNKLTAAPFSPEKQTPMPARGGGLGRGFGPGGYGGGRGFTLVDDSLDASTQDTERLPTAPSFRMEVSPDPSTLPSPDLSSHSHSQTNGDLNLTHSYTPRAASPASPALPSGFHAPLRNKSPAIISGFRIPSAASTLSPPGDTRSFSGGFPPPDDTRTFSGSFSPAVNQSLHEGQEYEYSPAKPAQTPTEDLLRSGDYNSVFKSRPKIALSPQFSPTKVGSPGGYMGRGRGLNIDLGEEDLDL